MNVLKQGSVLVTPSCATNLYSIWGDEALWNIANTKRIYLDQILRQMHNKVEKYLNENNFAMPEDISIMLSASLCNMSRLLPHVTWFSKFLIKVVAPAMTDQYLANVFPLLRQLCSIIRIDCSHKTAKHRREKVVQKTVDKSTNEITTKVCIFLNIMLSHRWQKTKFLQML